MKQINFRFWSHMPQASLSSSCMMITNAMRITPSYIGQADYTLKLAVGLTLNGVWYKLAKFHTFKYTESPSFNRDA